MHDLDGVVGVLRFRMIWRSDPPPQLNPSIVALVHPMNGLRRVAGPSRDGHPLS